MKGIILDKLREFHKEQGVAFLSEKEAEEYFQGLVELIESIIKESNINI